MNTIIDNREREICKFFRERGHTWITYKNLDVGDMLIGDRIVIERKTLKDLSASIKDGRYKEQKDRLRATGIPLHNIIFLIEGDFREYTGKYLLPSSTLKSSILHTQIRDGFSVFRTVNIRETIDFIERLSDTAFNNPQKLKLKSDISEFRDVINIRKIKNITPETYYFSLLTHIPCVSKIIAKYVVNEYPSILSLCEAYKTLETREERLGMLKECKIKTSTGKDRRIGKRASENIYIYISGGEGGNADKGLKGSDPS